MNKLTDVTDAISKDVATALRQAKRYATGKTEKEILSVSVSDLSAQLTAPSHIQQLVYGRNPTSDEATKGTPPLIDLIKEWCIAKGIPIEAAWVITRSIHKYGYKGTPDLLVSPLSDANVNKHLDGYLGNLATITAHEILDSLNI